MGTIKENYVVTKRNVLNELRTNTMTLNELRFFTIYLSKINSKDINTKLVKFPLEDFKLIMGLEHTKPNYIKQVTNSLLSKVVSIPKENGGYTSFQLFKECTVDMNEFDEWYIEIEAHDKALPLMFEFKEKYFTYKLWNALKLKSVNQLRMFEILKQYEKIGYRVLKVDDLKELLGLTKEEYARFGNFKDRVLDPCQRALKENTDICFEYEPHGKRGKGGKVISLKFTIKKNNNYTDELTLDEFIEQKKSDEEIETIIDEPKSKYDELIDFIADACNNEFSTKEMIVIHNSVLEDNQPLTRDNIKYFDFIKSKYDELNMRAEKTEIKNRFGYFKSLVKE